MLSYPAMPVVSRGQIAYFSFDMGGGQKKNKRSGYARLLCRTDPRLISNVT